MALTSIIQILKVNDPRTGNKNGRDWKMQDAECVLLTDDGQLDQVGVLPLSKEMMGDSAPKPGIYVGTYAMRAGLQDRRITPVLTALTPYSVPKAAPKTPGAAS